MNRRRFLEGSTSIGLGLALSGFAIEVPDRGPLYSTRNARWQKAYDKALSILAGNVQGLSGVEDEVLIEGAQYRGIWLECAPHEAQVYCRFRPDVARNTQLAFFQAQHPDGQFPAWLRDGSAGFGQIQMVVPIAATSWEIARATGDSELLETAYKACSRWDRWLVRYRNTRGTGLIEGFCTFDTGQDNSPRWRGIPNQCPHGDARRSPRLASLPRLAPDLSASAYGGRMALAEMARALGKNREADAWTESAEALGSLILKRLYVPEDGAFYDLDRENHFVRIRSEVVTRVCGEHVPDQKTFDEIWERQLHNERAFWAPYPFPSLAMDDPQYAGDLAGNSWGGPSQALTALRACRWMDHYNRSSEASTLMDRWSEAIERDMTFRQQVNPKTGVFAPHDQPGYSPSCLALVAFTWRLAGVVDHHSVLRWNVRPDHPAADQARYSLVTDGNLRAELRYAKGAAELELAQKPVARVTGGTVGLITTPEGKLESALGISEREQSIEIAFPSATRKLTVHPNQRILL